MADFNNFNQQAGIPMGIPGVPQPQYANAYNNAMNMPYMAQFNGGFIPNQAAKMPLMRTALTPEEIKQLSATVNTNILDLNVSPEDLMKSKCYHNDGTKYTLSRTNDGMLYCHLCKRKFDPKSFEKEEVERITNQLVDMMQQMKLTCTIPPEVGSEFFTMMPLLEKIPQMYEYTTKSMEKLLGNDMYSTAQELNSNIQYNNLTNRMYGYPQYSYNNNAFVNPYNNGVTMPQNNYYDPMMMQNSMQYNPAATMTNPMQTMPYGFNQQVPNQQFANQANMMMNNQQMMNGSQQYQQQPVTQQQVAQQPVQPQVTTTEPDTIKI